MSKHVWFSFLIVGLSVAWWGGHASADPEAEEAPVRRYALIASASDGGPQRALLRTADGDALAMAGVLRRLGGLRDSDMVLLTGARRDTLEASFAWLRVALAQGAGPGRRELVVYYAGHADEQGLLLGGDRVSYRELTDWIDSTAADVRIAILDRCAARPLPRAAGPDLAAAGRGALLAIGSADGGATFTHALVSGLRGAADASRDGRVTLAEAYRFAHGETRRRAGRRHAANLRLLGDGDLVLTRLRASKASLVLEPQLAGGVAVTDLSGRVVLELRKRAKLPVELGLEPGAYQVSLVRGGLRYRASVTLDDGAAVRLGSAQFAGPGEPVGSDPAPAADAAIDRESEPRRPRQFGVYAGAGLRYTRLGGADGLLAAPEVGFRLDRRIAVGLMAGGGYGEGGEGGRMSLAYAQLFARYQLVCGGSIVCLSVAAAAGPGVAEQGGQGNDTLLLFEPQVAAHLIASRFLHFGADLGYRVVAGADNYDAGELRGVAAGLHLQLGWF